MKIYTYVETTEEEVKFQNYHLDFSNTWKAFLIYLSDDQGSQSLC